MFEVSDSREKMCLHIIHFQIFIHTSVNIIFKIIIYMLIGKYILVIFHRLFVIRILGGHAHLSEC